MENVAGEHLQNLIKNLETSDCHRIFLFNDEGLKRGYFDIFDMLFPFLAFVKL